MSENTQGTWLLDVVEGRQWILMSLEIVSENET